MKKIVLCLLFISCFGLCFGQVDSMSEFLMDYIFTEMPFIENYMEKSTNDLFKSLEQKGFVLKSKNLYTLPRELYPSYVFQNDNSSYTPIEFEYVIGTLKITLASETNFYWIQKAFTKMTYSITELGTNYMKFASDYSVWEITATLPEFKDGYFITKITLERNLKV